MEKQRKNQYPYKPVSLKRELSYYCSQSKGTTADAHVMISINYMGITQRKAHHCEGIHDIGLPYPMHSIVLLWM